MSLNSSYQSIRGTVLAAVAAPQRWRSALLSAAEPHFRYTAGLALSFVRVRLALSLALAGSLSCTYGAIYAIANDTNGVATLTFQHLGELDRSTACSSPRFLIADARTLDRRWLRDIKPSWRPVDPNDLTVWPPGCFVRLRLDAGTAVAVGSRQIRPYNHGGFLEELPKLVVEVQSVGYSIKIELPGDIDRFERRSEGLYVFPARPRPAV